MKPTESFDFSLPGPYSIRLKKGLMWFDTPKVMGIINVTPDSFYHRSRVGDEGMERAVMMLAEGADIIDIGGCSSRPGASDISETEEYDRLAPALDAIRAKCPEAVISIDTSRAVIAEKCVNNFGADMINDISAGTYDPEMIPVVASLGVPYIIMHMRGTPQSMNSLCDYGDVTADVLGYLMFRVDECHAAGIHDVIVDPGFGFAKTPDQNYRLLNDLDIFHSTGCPVLAGLSRKSMLSKPLGIIAEDALDATVSMDTVALLNGADIIRVHDVKPAVQTVRLLSELKKAGNSYQFTINRSAHD